MKASQGVYADESGPEMQKMLLALSISSNWPLVVQVQHSAVVPDDAGQSTTHMLITSLLSADKPLDL